MSKATIELELNIEEYNLIQKVLRNYQGKFERLTNKELGEHANRRVAQEAEILNKLISEVTE